MSFLRRSMLPGFALVLLVSTVLAGEFADDWTWDRDPQKRQAHAELEGKPMPALELEGWSNGEVKADDMKGKVVVIDFFATWCGPCINAIPKNNELYAKHKDKGLVLIGVCTADGQEKADAVIKEHKVQYPSAKDPQLAAKKAWRVMYYPTYAVVDRKGIVRVVGLQPKHLETVIEKLLAEK